jgi:hypothetical protein
MLKAILRNGSNTVNKVLQVTFYRCKALLDVSKSLVKLLKSSL